MASPTQPLSLKSSLKKEEGLIYFPFLRLFIG